MEHWIETSEELPPEDLVVKARTDANYIFHLRRVGSTWYTEDRQMHFTGRVVEWKYTSFYGV